MSAPETDRMPQFDGRNGKFDGGHRVHYVAPQPWIAGLTVPGPACHTGSASFDPEVFQPSNAPADCLRCLRIGPTQPTPGIADPDQLTLALHHPEDDSDDSDDDAPCLTDCVCRWCTTEIDITPFMITLRPDPAYL